MITLYGIPNCDTMKKARKWLEENNLQYTFHNYKKEGITRDKISKWCNKAGIDKILNRRGTTWRKLDQETAASLNEEGLLQLMSEQPSLIKRPVVEKGAKLLVGFSPDEFRSLL